MPAVTDGSSVDIAVESCSLTDTSLCPTILSDFEVTGVPGAGVPPIGTSRPDWQLIVGGAKSSLRDGACTPCCAYQVRAPIRPSMVGRDHRSSSACEVAIESTEGHSVEPAAVDRDK